MRIIKVMSKQLDVLFVHPNGAPIIYQELSKTYSAIEPPIWAALLANNARKNGWSARILDCEAERLNAMASADTINDYNPRLVVVDTMDILDVKGYMEFEKGDFKGKSQELFYLYRERSSIFN